MADNNQQDKAANNSSLSLIIDVIDLTKDLLVSSDNIPTNLQHTFTYERESVLHGDKTFVYIKFYIYFLTRWAYMYT